MKIKRGIFLLGSMLLLGSAIKAQAPCDWFEPPSPQGNWVTTLCTATYTNTNPLDFSYCVTLSDKSGTSYFGNQVDFVNLGKNYLGKCLFFNFNVKEDGFAGSVPIFPKVFLKLGTKSIYFESNASITEGSQWIRVYAPIAHAAMGILPSNVYGKWKLGASTSLSDFNSVMDGNTETYFEVDFSASPTETISIDNVCINDCVGCDAGFRFVGDFTDLPDPNPDKYKATIALDYENPLSTYEVSWGDGTTSKLPLTPGREHTYAKGGTYEVCVTEFKNGIPDCKTCMTFCIEETTGESSGKSRKQGVVEPMSADPQNKTINR